MANDNPYVRWFTDLSADDVAVVGGKNASLGEMMRALQEEGIQVPDGFALTVAAYQAFLDSNALEPKIQAVLTAVQPGHTALARAGKALRKLVRQAPFPADVAAVGAVGHTLLDQFVAHGAGLLDVHAEAFGHRRRIGGPRPELGHGARILALALGHALEARLEYALVETGDGARGGGLGVSGVDGCEFGCVPGVRAPHLQEERVAARLFENVF